MLGEPLWPNSFPCFEYIIVVVFNPNVVCCWFVNIAAKMFVRFNVFMSLVSCRVS